MSITKVLSVAKGEVGEHEKRSGGHWVNDSKYTRWFGTIPGYSQGGYGYPWCAVFVTWCAHKAGAASLYPKTAGCATAVNWFKNKGRFSAYPAVGAQIFFGSGGGAHTGIVYAYDADYVYTYEGNTNTNGSAEGDGVYAKKRARRDAYVYGYGYPDVAGSLSADPNAKKFGYKHAAKSSTAKPKLEPFPGATFFKGKPKSPVITAMGKRLVAVGCSAYKVGPGAQWSDADKASYAKWQRKQGFTGADADGWPGKATWDALKVPKV
ncbi:CHAP domain-containing protein [Streptomyces sp. CB04723]|uniref:peptidoglycan-binding protein n=1 Tax=Streptomyces TaxID=1883 RepID=UPI0015C4C82E|nr:peptidoglycan-binding protein [Streptomyces sp. CB04723]QLG33012.1 CHAP domain-containing protein [Streptomyces sp. CB04723]